MSKKKAKFKKDQVVSYYGNEYLVEDVYPTSIGFFYKLSDRLGKVSEGVLKLESDKVS